MTTSNLHTLAEILYSVDPDRQPWDGDEFSFFEALSRGEYGAKTALAQASLLQDLGWVKEGTDMSMWEIYRKFGKPKNLVKEFAAE